MMGKLDCARAMFCFHKWGYYGETKETDYKKRRICSKCGKHQYWLDMSPYASSSWQIVSEFKENEIK